VVTVAELFPACASAAGLYRNIQAVETLALVLLRLCVYRALFQTASLPRQTR
jgi:hypothetical protein